MGKYLSRDGQLNGSVAAPSAIECTLVTRWRVGKEGKEAGMTNWVANDHGARRDGATGQYKSFCHGCRNDSQGKERAEGQTREERPI